MVFYAKDFIETAEGLLFAVVANDSEQGRVRCFLRYLQQNGRWAKIDTDRANQYLSAHHPEYLYHSPQLDADLHAVELSRIVRHYPPKQVLQQLLQATPSDAVLEDLQQLCRLFAANGLDLEQFGVTGSLLVGMQNSASDIDLVCYQRASFHQARNVVQALIAADRCQALNDADWLAAFQRRACDLALDEYIWHEQRKYNKAIINQRKFDLSLLVLNQPVAGRFRKQGFRRIEAVVIDAEHGFDYPARFSIDHPEINSVVCFTATYTGQAKNGERIVVAGQLESDETGRLRIVVGSSREAIGEFIRVLR